MTGTVTAAILACIVCSASGSVQVWVNPSSGSDSGPGTQADPFRTVGRAQQAVRAGGPGSEVHLTAGTYVMARNGTLSLGPEDSNCTWVADDPGTAIFEGGLAVQSPWTLVEAGQEPDLPASSIGYVFSTSLWDPANGGLGPGDVGVRVPSFQQGSNQLGIYFKGTPQWRARWPNRPPEPSQGNWTLSRDGYFNQTYLCYEFEDAQNRSIPSASRWAGLDGLELELALHGMFRYSWRDEWAHLKSVNASIKCLFSNETIGAEGGAGKGGGFIGEGWVGDLDAPGEYHLNTTTGRLLLWPLQQDTTPESYREQPVHDAGLQTEPGAFHANGGSAMHVPGTHQWNQGRRWDPLAAPGSGDVVVSVQRDPLVAIQDATGVTLDGLVLRHGQGTLLVVVNSTAIDVRETQLREGGHWGANVAGGTGVEFNGCNVTDMGEGGISMQGGVQTDLTPGLHAVRRSRFWRYAQTQLTYKPAVSVGGVGNLVEQCEIWDAPHQAISFGGNSHVMRLNAIHDVMRMTYDSGAIYADRNVIDRGTVIEDSLFYRLGNRSAPDVHCSEATSCIEQAVYVDDFFSEVTMQRCIVADSLNGFFSHHGRNHTVRNNLFLQVSSPANFAGSFEWGKLESKFQAQLASVPYQGALWAARYPDLATILANQTQRQYNAALPRRISVGLNLAYNNTELNAWEVAHGGWEPAQDGVWSTGGGFRDPRYCVGCVLGQSAESECNGCFTTWANFGIPGNQSSPFMSSDPLGQLNFTLRQDAPVWKHGWERIPQAAIGPNGIGLPRED